MNETLEAMAQAIFTDWFVDFGPTRAKAEGRAPYLASELWDFFPDTFDAILTAFSEVVSPFRAKIESAKVESRSLAQTRDLLLSKLMSGEIRLAEAEKAVEAVA